MVNSALLRPQCSLLDNNGANSPKINASSRTFARRKLTSSICEDLFIVDDEMSGPEIITKVSHGSNRGDNKEMFSECAISKGHC